MVAFAFAVSYWPREQSRRFERGTGSLCSDVSLVVADDRDHSGSALDMARLSLYRSEAYDRDQQSNKEESMKDAPQHNIFQWLAGI